MLLSDSTCGFAVFATLLRTTPRTLENWEQGRASANNAMAVSSMISPANRMSRRPL